MHQNQRKSRRRPIRRPSHKTIPMKKTPKVGDKIRVIANSSNHNYIVDDGDVYTVIAVDVNDSTLRGQSPDGQEGNWIQWCDCEHCYGLGWEFIQSVLPEEVASFLSVFSGIEAVELRTDIKDGILKKLPNLHELIMEEHGRLKSASGKSALAIEEEAPFR